MFGLRLKAIRVYITLCFVLVTLGAAGGKEGEPKDVPKDGVYPKEGEPKDVPKDGVYPKEGEPKDVPKDDVKDTDPKDKPKEGVGDKIAKILENPDIPMKDQVTELLESLSPEDIEKLENITEEEAAKKIIFLTPEEGCDFLGMGPLFDDPNYYKDLVMDYVTMENFGYWEMRCEEATFKGPADPNDKDTAAQKPSYCT